MCFSIPPEVFVYCHVRQVVGRAVNMIDGVWEILVVMYADICVAETTLLYGNN